jgi:hypothetical protein
MKNKKIKEHKHSFNWGGISISTNQDSPRIILYCKCGVLIKNLINDLSSDLIKVREN